MAKAKAKAKAAAATSSGSGTGRNVLRIQGCLVQWEIESASQMLKSCTFRMGHWIWQLQLTRGIKTNIEILPWKGPAEQCVANLFIKIQSFPVDKQPVMDEPGLFVNLFSDGIRWTVSALPSRLIIEIKFIEMRLVLDPFGFSNAIVLPSHQRILHTEGFFHARSGLSRMLREGILTDITVNVEGGSIRAHRAVLAARSPVFMRMFTVDLKEKLLSTVDITDMSLEGCRAFIGYLYNSNSDDETLAHVDELLAASHKYDVKDLRTVCETIMAEETDTEKLLERLQMAHFYQLPELKWMFIRLLVEFRRMYEIPEDFDAFLKTADSSLDRIRIALNLLTCLEEEDIGDISLGN
ncbi:hypothetical protein ABZP36_035183 [Zizania latifolia]